VGQRNQGISIIPKGRRLQEEILRTQRGGGMVKSGRDFATEVRWGTRTLGRLVFARGENMVAGQARAVCWL